MRALAAILLFALPVLATAQSLGSIDFPTSAQNTEAQVAFERGLLLLHSFEYDDARDAFQEARQLEGTVFPMASWGEAMTHNRPIWQQQDLEEGRAALINIGDYPNGVDDMEVSERERGYLRAAFGMFFGEGDKETRDDAFELAMAELAAAYPDDLDAQSLWALSILGTAHEGRDFPTYMRAAAILEEVFARNPEHPGAAHYLIHAYDDAIHAPLGLRPARVYDKIAPDASHALHMPSHIYLALGMWDETAEMNRRSYEAAKANSERRGEPLNNHGWHALYWRTYAELQRGEVETAYELLGTARQLADADPSVLARTHLVRIRANLAVELLAWSDPRLAFEIDTEGTSQSTRAMDLLIRAAAAGGAEGASSIADELRQLADAPDASPTVRATALTLDAMMADADGDIVSAEAALREAVGLMEERPLTFGPPTPAFPPHEVLGLWLIEQGRFDEAAEAFEGALALAPGRTRSVRMLEMARGESSSREEFD
ncbi:MAG: tetratricopeptide repeat protein, partial [Bacteroidota bacterium]